MSNDAKGMQGSDKSSTHGNQAEVNVKEEKFDPEIEKKLQEVRALIKTHQLQHNEKNESTAKIIDKKPNIRDCVNGVDADGASQESQSDDSATPNGVALEEDKKRVEPLKSSNELLAELFQVFNAAPPEELLDGEVLKKKKSSHRKHKKHKKEKKQRKHKKSKGYDESDEGEDNEADPEPRPTCDIKSELELELRQELDGSSSEKPYEEEEEEGSSSLEGKSRKHKKKKKRKKDEEKRHKSKEKTSDNKKKEKAEASKCSTDEVSGKLTISITNSREGGNRVLKRKVEAIDINRVKEEPDRKRHNGHRSSKDNESKERDYKYKEDTKKDRDNEEETKPRNSQTSDLDISDISLSDEETYRKESESHSKERNSSNPFRTDKRLFNSFYAGEEEYERERRNRERSRNENNYDRRNASRERHHRDRGRERESGRDHDRKGPRSVSRNRLERRRLERSRSRSRSRNLGIDKKRLLEIARKNAISMFKRGNLPGYAAMSEEVKDKVLLKMRYGGKTVEDLTEFCKRISKGEHLSDLSSSDEDVDADGQLKAFHHPFMVKEREPIVMQIRSARPVAPKNTDDVKKAITMQFPVSSGSQHRMSEKGWTPVEALPPLPPLPAATQSTTLFKKAVVESNVFGKSLPEAERQEPAFRPLPGNPIGGTEQSSDKAMEKTMTEIPKEPTETTNPVGVVVEKPFVPDVPVPSSTHESVFPEVSTNSNLDVTSIISKRLNAMRRLQENPMDAEAIKMMYTAKKEMSTWANSKHVPGQFTGSTGANVLSATELNKGPQAWARKDQLLRTQPLSGGMGMHLLQKMGWRPGEGLGRQRNGSTQPLLLDIKLDKRGFDITPQNNVVNYATPAEPPITVPSAGGSGGGGGGGGAKHKHYVTREDLKNKHPVCLLNELSAKRKWIPPRYNCINEQGMAHARFFRFSIEMNGCTYTPEQGANTKKEAKLKAAKYCLEQLGILPKDI